jgi:hypothetical protein
LTGPASPALAGAFFMPGPYPPFAGFVKMLYKCCIVSGMTESGSDRPLAVTA